MLASASFPKHQWVSAQPDDVYIPCIGMDLPAILTFVAIQNSDCNCWVGTMGKR
jgi:hypothetical protein